MPVAAWTRDALLSPWGVTAILIAVPEQ